VDKYTWIDIGSSYLPGEITAAFLFAQLENAQAITRRRRELCAEYARQLGDLEAKGFFTLPKPVADRVDSGHISYVLARSPEEREELRRFLVGDGIQAVTHYVPLHSAAAGQRYGRTPGPMPHTDRVANTLLRLPLFHEMTEGQMARGSNACAPSTSGSRWSPTRSTSPRCSARSS
jgi:dTDP-4-amino-4,6-dideoxygalactose transaminase